MKVVTILILLFSWSFSIQAALSSARPLETFTQSVLQRAPYLESRVSAYLTRLDMESARQPVIYEFAELLNRYTAGEDVAEIQATLYERYDATFTLTPTAQLNKPRLHNAMEIRINTANSNCWNVDVALNPHSEQILAVWQDERNGVENPDIWGQFFDLDLNPIGDNFRVHSGNTDIAQAFPSVAALSNGGFVVVWEDDRLGDAAIYGRLFDADRTPVAQDFNIAKIGTHLNPAVAADGNGMFTVTWLVNEAGDYNVYARQYEATGTALTTAFKINDDLNTFQWFPVIASAPTGESLIVWEDKRDSNSDIYAQRLRADGSKRAGNFRVDDSRITSKQWRPAVTAANSGFVVTWEDYRDTPVAIYAQWLDASLLVEGHNLRIDDVETESLKETPDVALHADGGTTFVWQDSRTGTFAIFARSLDAHKQHVQLAHIAGGMEDHNAREAKLAVSDEIVNVAWMDKQADQTWQNVYARQLDRDALPVELRSFHVTHVAGRVECRWSTVSETNNRGFSVQRRSVDSEFSDIGFVDGHGTTQQPQQYRFVDAEVPPGTYEYCLKQWDTDGSTSLSHSVFVTVSGPTTFVLYDNVPNPFNPETAISFALPHEAHVHLEIFNIQGHRVTQLLNERRSAGHHTLRWDGTDTHGHLVASGLYFYKLTVGDFTELKKMLLAR